MEFISEGIFGKYSKMKILGLNFLKGSLKTVFFYVRVGYVYIVESFDNIFNMGYGSGKSAMGEKVKANPPF